MGQLTAEPTLQFGLVCLRNALYLIDSAKDVASATPSPSASSPSTAQGVLDSTFEMHAQCTDSPFMQTYGAFEPRVC